MNKKTIKIITVLSIIALMLIASTPVFADAGFAPDQLTGTAPTGTDIQDMGNKIVGILQAVGTVIAVVILIVIGIKYIMGSAEEKAEYKKTLMPYVIGAILIFGAAQIAGLIAKIKLI